MNSDYTICPFCYGEMKKIECSTKFLCKCEKCDVVISVPKDYNEEPEEEC